VSRRRRILLIALLLAASIIGAAWWWKSREQHSARETALQLARTGRFSEAEPALLAAYQRDPGDTAVVEALAREYLTRDDLRAQEYLSRWVALQPDRREAWLARADYYKRRQEHERAYLDTCKAIELSPNDSAQIESAMGLAFSAGRFAESEQLCRRLLGGQPSDPGLRALLAQILRARGDPAGAAAILDQLLAENPRNTRAIFARAILYQENGEPEKAVPMLREILQVDPSRQRTAGYQLSLALEQIGKPEEARKVMQEVRRLQDIEVFRGAIQNQPDNLELQVRLARQLLTDGHTQDGLGLLQVVLSRDPGFRPAHGALADYYEKEGQTESASKHRKLAGGT
jgi:Tfp pilus assembly protein PilF